MSETQDLFSYLFDPVVPEEGRDDTSAVKNIKPCSVSELTRRIRMVIEGTFDTVWVEGEISNFKAHISGHYYFTLKDANAQIPAVMFRNANAKLKFTPENGMLVTVTGKIQIYEPQGKYQVVCEKIEPSGIGSLQVAFEQLKKKLTVAGLFDQNRKKALPAFPRTIGIVTSPSGAAIRDIITVIFRRFPHCRVVVNPVAVQGEGAAEQIARAIDEFNEVNSRDKDNTKRGLSIDVMIVGRGGGSMEDLWAFNEEIVALAIARSSIPVISAVGHETDWTIADMVADVRAPTPSAAAEIVIQPREAWLQRIRDNERRLRTIIKTMLDTYLRRLSRVMTHYAFREPPHMVDMFRQRVDELTGSMHQAIHDRIMVTAVRLTASQHTIQAAVSVFSGIIQGNHDVLQLRTKMLQRATEIYMVRSRDRLERNLNQLEVMGPTAVIRRGFTITRCGGTGEPVSSSSAVQPGETILTEFYDGIVHSNVKEVQKKQHKI